jgi:hypothetical protein
MRGAQQAASRTSPERPLPLETARECFAWLVTGPQPLSIDGRDFPGLPDRMVALDELRDRLLRRRCPQRTRDAVWAELVRHSREQGATWTLACVGMALPALASAARWVSARYPDDDPFDVHAEVLSGFLSALSTINLARPQVLVRLKWAAYRAGLAGLSEALNAPTPMPPGFRSAPPSPPWGHPDLLLAEAVRFRVLTRTEAELIGTTRLEDLPVSQWAADQQTRITTQSAYKLRRRAERRLVAYLRDRTRGTDSEDPVADHVTTALTPPATDADDFPQPDEASLSVTSPDEGSVRAGTKKV